MATIKLENIEKCYTKDIPVIKNLDLEINELSIETIDKIKLSNR